MTTILLQKLKSTLITKELFSFVMLLWLGLVTVETAHSQVSSYQLDQLQSPGFAAIAAAATPAPIYLAPTNATNVDNGVYNIPTLPFAFQFNGASYTSANVSVNGFLTFGATAPSLTEVAPIASGTAYSGAISAFGSDLDILNTSTTRTILYQVTGNAPNRIMKIQWNVLRDNNPGILIGNGTAPSPAQTLLMQVWLYETTNVIEMHYNTNATTSTFDSFGQIGLRGASNADFKTLTHTSGHWPGVAPAPVGVMATGGNASTVFFDNNAQIQATSNRLFRFTPVTCVAPTGVAITPGSITATTATLTWNAASPAPANGYDYYVTTSPTAPVAGTTPTGSVGAGVLTANLTSLTAGALQYVYVRSRCSGSDISSWTIVLNFTTFCNAVNVPYLQEFDAGVVPNAVAPGHTNLPTCTTQQNAGTGNPWVVTNQDLHFINANMDGNILMYNGQSPGNANPANVWFYTQGINLTAGTTYTIDYLYGGTAIPSTVQNKMRVAYGTYPNAANMTTILDNHPDIKSSSFNNIVNFTAPSTGVFYFGFQAYSNPNNGQLYVDTIQVYPSNCLRATAVSVQNITGTTALLSWTAPTPAPANGYAYYLSTSSTPPTNSTVPTGLTAAGITNVNLTGLTGLTTYYFWVRGNCGFGNFGEWVALNNAGSPSFTTLTPPPVYCLPSGNGFFQDPNGITNVLMGSINNTTGIETNNYGNYTNLVTNVAQGATVPCSITYATGFTYDTNIWVDWNGDGDFADTGELVYVGVSTATNPTTLAASFVVPAGQPLGPVRLRIGGVDFGPFNDPCRNNSYQAFEDYTINVIVPPPALTISSSGSAQCAGTASPTVSITTPLANFNAYSWSPASGVTGNSSTGYTFTNTATTVYTLTGTQTVAPFSTNTTTFTYTANPLPTPITITTPSGTVACPAGSTGGAVQLVASGGIVAGVPILAQNFNGVTNDWVVTNNGGSPVGVWTLRPDGYAEPLNVTHSNDSSQFYLADSDSPGIGSTVSTFLTSPAFSTMGYTQASLSFWHFYQFFSGDTGKVQVSTNGTSWTDLVTYSSNIGTSTNFLNVNLPLNAYLNQPTVYIRFRYDATWDWSWAIDNVLVSGSASSSVTWSPIAGLYNDAAATSAYVAGTGASTVYALPTTATTYTASASTPVPVCSTSTTVAVTVANLVAGTASNNQSVCNGIAADLNLAGYTGTITGWQSADNAGFTVGLTTIPSSASATLTSAQIGTISAPKYFRAVITNGTCTMYSNVITIQLDSTTYNGVSWSNGVPDATKAAIFAGNYSSTGNLSACSVVVNSGNIVFNSGHTLTAQNAVTVSGGSLTFEDDSSLVQVNDVVNTGNITYRRITPDVRLYDFTYWSAPVSPQTLSNLSPLTLSDKYFVYNPGINNWQGIASSNLMVAGTGYIIRAPQNYSATVPAPFTGVFVGVPNNGTISTNITVGSGTLNLIGNPYPSAINADLFLSDSVNDARIGGTIYLWTHNTAVTANNYSVADYALYTYSGGIGTGSAAPGVNNTVPNGRIAAGQSFMIEGSIPASTNPVFFRNSMRVVGNNNQFFRLGSQDKGAGANTVFSLEKHRVWLEVSNDQGAYKQILVGYIENATNGLDRGYDGKVFDLGNEVFLYTKVDGVQLGVQGRTLPFDVNDTVALGFKSTTVGNYHIRLSDFDGLFDEQNVYLEDTYLNVIHDLKSGDYSFTTNSGTFEDRFILRYTNSTLGSVDTTFTENSVFIYKENKEIIVNASNNIIDSITIHDVRGSQLYTKSKINATNFVVSNLTSSEQVLIVTVTSIDGKKVTKKIVY